MPPIRNQLAAKPQLARGFGYAKKMQEFGDWLLTYAQFAAPPVKSPCSGTCAPLFFQAIELTDIFLAYLLSVEQKSLCTGGVRCNVPELPTKFSTDFVDKNIAFMWQGINVYYRQ